MINCVGTTPSEVGMVWRRLSSWWLVKLQSLFSDSLKSYTPALVLLDSSSSSKWYRFDLSASTRACWKCSSAEWNLKSGRRAKPGQAIRFTRVDDIVDNAIIRRSCANLNFLPPSKTGNISAVPFAVPFPYSGIVLGQKIESIFRLREVSAN